MERSNFVLCLVTSFGISLFRSGKRQYLVGNSLKICLGTSPNGCRFLLGRLVGPREGRTGGSGKVFLANLVGGRGCGHFSLESLGRRLPYR